MFRSQYHPSCSAGSVVATLPTKSSIQYALIKLAFAPTPVAKLITKPMLQTAPKALNLIKLFKHRIQQPHEVIALINSGYRLVFCVNRITKLQTFYNAVFIDK